MTLLTNKDSMPLTVRRVASTTPSVSLLSFRLPKSTRPGSYEGKVELGDARIPIRIEVEARPRLRFIPAKLSLRGGPGAVIQTEGLCTESGECRDNHQAQRYILHLLTRVKASTAHFLVP